MNLIPIGIDLGTTYSVVATVSPEGTVAVLPNAAGGEKTPSVVLFEDARTVVVGDEAKDAVFVVPDRVVSVVKRHMGDEHPMEFGGKEWSPESISSLILKSLADAASAHLDVPASRFGVVVTVPAYFGVAQREATAQAVEIAGLRLLELIPEPQAAALFSSPNAKIGETALIFDLGGGTLDTTLLQFTAKGPQCVVVDGHAALGGVDWDTRLSDLLREKYVEVSGIDEYDLEDDFDGIIQAEAEKLKMALSMRSSQSVTLRSARTSARVTVTRREFEEATAVLIEECVAAVTRTLSEGGHRGVSVVDAAVLVGGSTRMPLIASFLEERFGIPTRVNEPDLAVAKGAALHAWSLCGRPGGRSGGLAPKAVPGKYVPSSVLPKGLGFAYHDSADPEGQRKRIHFVVRKNDRLPVIDAEATFATILNGQKTIRVEMYEQMGDVLSEDIEHNRKVFDAEISGMGCLPAGSPVTVRLSIDANGRIHDVRAVEKRSGKSLRVAAFLEGVADSLQLSKNKKVVAMLSVTT